MDRGQTPHYLIPFFETKSTNEINQMDDIIRTKNTQEYGTVE